MVIFFIFYLNYDGFFSVQATFKNLLISVLTGFIVVGNLTKNSSLLYKFLNLKILNFIGILSYSIYIWQQLFTANDDKFSISKYPINLIFIIVIPCISYFLFEKYFLKLKNKFSRINKRPPSNLPN